MGKIKIKETKAFIELLGKAAAATSNKDTIRSGVMIAVKDNEVSMRGMNEAVSVQVSAKDITEVKEEISFVVPAKIFLDMMKKLPKGDVELIIGDTNMSIKVGKSLYGISTLSVDDFPLHVAYEEGIIFQVNGPTFASSLQTMVHACAETETRPILTGVHIVSNGKYLTLIATDSHRLMANAVPILKETEEFKNVVVPKASVKELTSLLTDQKEVEFSISRNQLSLKTEGVLFTTRLLEGSFPDVTKLIPMEFVSEVVVHREELLKALDRTKTMIGKERVAKLETKSGNLSTLVIERKTETTNVYEELFVDEVASEIALSLNIYYLIDAIQAMDSKKLRIQFSGALKPIIVRPEVEGATQFGLLLPVR
jgi:DNA polymerase III subunit beta